MKKLFILAMAAAVLAGGAAYADTEQEIEKAYMLYRARDFQGAVEQYGRVLPELQGEAAARVHLAIGKIIFYEQSSDYHRAMQLYRETGKRRDTSSEGVSAAQADKYEQAQEAFRNVLETEGALPETMARAQFFIAQSCYERQSYEKAVEEYGKFISMKGTDTIRVSDAQLYTGHSYFHMKQYEKAIEEYRKVAEIKGAASQNLSYAQLQLGHCYTELKKNDIAQAEYAKVFYIEGAHWFDLFRAMQKALFFAVQGRNNMLELMVDGFILQVKTHQEKELVTRFGREGSGTPYAKEFEEHVKEAYIMSWNNPEL